MKIQALILVFPFAVFLTETASFTPAMKAACEAVTAKKSSCPKMQEPGKCQTKKENGKKKPSGKTCNDTPDCSTCPVCYTFIFQPQFEWPAEQAICKKKFSLLNTGNLFSYSPDVWKPPNGPVYSS
jgi:hypothetical protein